MREINKISKRTVTINGRNTSVTLEAPFWKALKLIAQKRNLGVSKLVQEVYEASKTGNLSSSIRLYVLHHYLDRLG